VIQIEFSPQRWANIHNQISDLFSKDLTLDNIWIDTERNEKTPNQQDEYETIKPMNV